VFCGPGYDSVSADLIDTVALDCELINIGPQPQQVIMNAPPPSVDTLLAKRGLRARLTCAAACAARADLLLPARARLLATGRAQRGSAGSLTVVTRLRRGAGRTLRRLHPARLTLRTTVVHGASTTVLQRSLRLRRR
jgi:hypothetical protein